MARSAISSTKISVREKKAHSLFMRRSYSVYKNMGVRCKEMTDNELPFDLELFRADIQHWIGRLCKYCGVDMTAKNFSADHATPIERGGGWDMSNVNIICSSCNLAKGRMDWIEFGQLMETLERFDPRVRKEVLGRLKAGASVIRLRFLKR